MQGISKQSLIVGSLALAVLAASVATGVEAKSENAGKGKIKAAEMKLKQVNRAPKVFKRTIPGKIVSITPTTTTVTDATTGATTTSHFSMVIQKGNKQYTVNTTGTTAFVDRKWKPIAQGDLKVGHKVTVKGMLTKGTTNVVANWVRDVSLPAKSTISTTE